MKPDDFHFLFPSLSQAAKASRACRACLSSPDADPPTCLGDHPVPPRCGSWKRTWHICSWKNHGRRNQWAFNSGPFRRHGARFGSTHSSSSGVRYHDDLKMKMATICSTNMNRGARGSLQQSCRYDPAHRYNTTQARHVEIAMHVQYLGHS